METLSHRLLFKFPAIFVMLHFEAKSRMTKIEVILLRNGLGATIF